MRVQLRVLLSACAVLKSSRNKLRFLFFATTDAAKSHVISCASRTACNVELLPLPLPLPASPTKTFTHPRRSRAAPRQHAARVNGQAGAATLESTHMYDFKMAAGAAYQCALADYLGKLGYQLERDGDGSFRISQHQT